MKRRKATSLPGWIAVALTTALVPLGCYSVTRTACVGDCAASGPIGSPVPAFGVTTPWVEPDGHLELEKAGTTYDRLRLQFPSVGDNGQVDDLVTVRYHRSTKPGRHPAVIVLPIWGRSTYPSKATVTTIRRRSDGRMHVLDVRGDDFVIPWPELQAAPDADTFTELWRQGAVRERNQAIDLLRLVDWAEQRPEIDADRIAIVAFSKGVMNAALAALHDQRFAAVLLVMGGAHPHEVIARCDGPRTVDTFAVAEGRFGWSFEAYEALLEKLFFNLDAARYPGRVDPSKVLMVKAGKDTCISETAYDDLWLALDRPERIVIDANHRKAFYTMTPLRLSWLRGDLWEFLERKLLR